MTCKPPALEGAGIRPAQPIDSKGLLAGKCTVSGENKLQTDKKPVVLAGVCELNSKGTAYDFFTRTHFVRRKNHNQSGLSEG